MTTKISDSARVRQLMADKPNLKPKEVAEQLGVAASLVYNIRSTDGRTPAKRTRRSRAARAKTVSKAPADQPAIVLVNQAAPPKQAKVVVPCTAKRIEAIYNLTSTIEKLANLATGLLVDLEK